MTPLHRVRAIAGTVALVLLASSPVRGGDGFRCGSRLVHEGDRIEDVQRRCGDPTSRRVSSELVTFRTHSGAVVTREIQLDTWTYDRGAGQFVRTLRFRDGRLIAIRAGEYGD